MFVYFVRGRSARRSRDFFKARAISHFLVTRSRAVRKLDGATLSNEIKWAIIQFIFYTAAGVKTYKELYVSPVSGLSLACRMQRNCCNDVQSCNR